MSASKHFDKIACVATALILVITIVFMNGTALGLEVKAHTMGYENRLFDNTRVHSIDIVMDNWSEFIANATSEEYYTAHVVIDGEAYKNIAIRGKGNTSLSTVSSLGSQRYSFKIEFDHYDNSITYHGLDKLSLNNLIQDSTMMKDYLAYTMMKEFGADSPLCSFVYITVNGEDWGLYLAVEGLEDAFLERNYGSDYGELYKPDSLSFGGGRGNGKDFDMGDFDFSGMEDTASNGGSRSAGGFDPSTMFGGDMSSMFGGQMPEEFDSSTLPEDFDISSMFGGEGGMNFGGMGGFGMGSSDVKLQYSDDNLSSYSNIWNNAKTDITEADQYRLIESLRKLTNGEDIASVVNVEQVLRYFVVHNYICNGDSYTGSMIHNYYLYEEDGQLTMLPWDYNLGYGTFMGGVGTSTVNTPIDAPVSGDSGSDRPMWYWILSNAEYTELYHQYYAEFLNTVDIQGIIDNAYNLIQSYVAKDPTAFFTYEEFELGVETMRKFCEYRSESISLQLENGQTATNMNYVDASDITLSNMGSMSGMGGFGGGMPDMSGNRGDRGDWQNENRENSSSTFPSFSSGRNTSSTNSSTGSIMTLAAPGSSSGGFGGQMPSGSMPGGQMPEGFDPSQMFGGEMPEGFDPSQMFGGEIPEGLEGIFGGQFSGNDGSSDDSSTSNKSEGSLRPGSSTTRPSGGDFNLDSGTMGSRDGNASGWIWILISVVILAVGIIIAKKYRY